MFSEMSMDSERNYPNNDPKMSRKGKEGCVVMAEQLQNVSATAFDGFPSIFGQSS